MFHTPWYVWLAFNVFVLIMLAVDLGVHRARGGAMSVKASLIWTGVWVAMGLSFAVGVWWFEDSQKAMEYLAGYVVEKSLSVDNIFVFIVIFRYFGVPGKHQHKVLVWGILGALIMRAAFIFAGVALISKFEWMTYLLGALLIYTSYRAAFTSNENIHPERNPVVRLARRFLPVSSDMHDGRFIAREAGGWRATPLLLVLITIETTDVIFATDSIPAILAITKDPFIVYSSNVFAILGLRAMYFTLAGLMQKLRYLHYGLAAVLAFVGVKMLIEHLYKIPIGASLGVVLSLLTISVIVSLIWPDIDEMPVAQDDTGDEGVSQR
jgi:tellurite resistance protein TerC